MFSKTSTTASLYNVRAIKLERDSEIFSREADSGAGNCDIAVKFQERDTGGD